MQTAPESLLLATESNHGMRAKFEKMIREAQDSICKAVEEVDGKKFREVRGRGGADAGRILRRISDARFWS